MKKVIMPKLFVDGVAYTPKRRIKTGLWRKCVKQENEEEEQTPAELMESRLNIIQEVFGVPKDKMDDIDVADILPAYRSITKMIWEVALSKMGEIPNVEKETEH